MIRQESITNALNHASPNFIVFLFSSSIHECITKITDDDILSTDVWEPEEEILNIRKRIAKLTGTLDYFQFLKEKGIRGKLICLHITFPIGGR